MKTAKQRIGWTLNRGLVFGVLLMLLLIGAVGAVGFVALGQALSAMDRNREINALENEVAAVRTHIDHYELAAFQDDPGELKKASEAVAAGLNRVETMVEALAASSELSGRADEAAAIRELLARYRAAFAEYRAMNDRKREMTGAIEAVFDPVLAEISQGRLWYQEMEAAFKVLAQHIRMYLNKPTESNWAQTEAARETFQNAAEDWYGRVEGSANLRGIAERIDEHFNRISESVAQFREATGEQSARMAAMAGFQEELQSRFEALQEVTTREVAGTVARAKRSILLFILAAVLAGGLYALLFLRFVSRRVDRVVGGVDEGARVVADNAGALVSSGQVLAEGASTQAASIQQMTASIEEISAMTRQNAENASQAQTLMEEVGTAVRAAGDDLERLTSSMEAIQQAGEDTAKIVKTIDEIAFQTNLLALNAAVEAARAGESGAGFAVVAGEVRNLASRAAEAARNTAGLIESTNQRVQAGSGEAARTTESFGRVRDGNAKVETLVAEISGASGEQARGIQEIGAALGEIDRIVQRNASDAEESAAAGETLLSQAKRLNRHISELRGFIGFDAGKNDEKTEGRRQLPAPQGEKQKRLTAE